MNNDEVKIGEYIRSKGGTLGKCIDTRYDFEDGEMCDEFITIEPWYIGSFKIPQAQDKSTIVKHSFDLIDVVEVGDVIRLKGEEKLKYEVLKISEDGEQKHIHIINPFITEGGKDIYIEDIAAIVTKEKFENDEYEVN